MLKIKGLFINYFLMVAFLFFPYGCGYHISHGENPAFPAWMKKVYVEPWSNNTNEIRLSSWITDDLRRQFLLHKTLNPSLMEEADVVISGEVRSIKNTGLSYVRFDQTVEREVIVECAVKMIERKTGKILWQTSNISRAQSYLVGRELMETEGVKEEALRKISRYMAEVIYHRIAEVF